MGSTSPTALNSSCSSVNKRYQAYFEARKAREAENEAAKTALCERIEALDYGSLKTFAAWDDMTKTIIALQEEWRTLGFSACSTSCCLRARFDDSSSRVLR